MARFTYTALDGTGDRVVGKVKGSSIEGVAQTLTDQGLRIQAVTPDSRSILQFEITPKKIDRVELANFSRQMSAFIAAGIPILDALAIIESESRNKLLRSVVAEVADSLRFGESFADAMGAHASAFPPFYMSVLRSAEATGQLDIVLAQLSAYLERDTEARRKIRSALAYPSIVMAMSLVTVLVLTIFVLPRFETFFQSFHAKLPLATRLLLSFTGFLTHWWGLLVGTVAAVGLTVLIGLRTAGGRHLRDALLLKLPIAGDVVRFTVIERFCRVLTSMLQSGVPIPEALQLASSGTNNSVYERALATARTQMLEGDGIARPIAGTKLFPGTVTQMTRVGEETGTLDNQLEALASYYSKELEYKLKRFTNVFEPLAVVMVGFIVGFVAIALISAIYGIYNQVKIQ